MHCLVPDPAIRQLAKSFPGETLRIITNAIGNWQEANNIDDIDKLPSEKELKDFIEKMRTTSSTEGSFKFSKDVFDNILINGQIPNSINELARDLGITISKDGRSNTISISGESSDDDSIALFKVLLADAYNNEIAEEISNVFGMNGHERLDAILTYEKNHRKYRNTSSKKLPIAIQVAKINIRERYELTSLTVMDELRRAANEAYSSNPQERFDRVSEITDLFSNILTRRFESEKQRLSDRRNEINQLIKDEDKGEYSSYDEAYHAYMNELSELQSKLQNMSRLSFLNEIGPKDIFDEIENTYNELLTLDKDAFADRLCNIFDANDLYQFFIKRDNAIKKKIRKALDNFEVLRHESCKELEVSELIRISISIEDNTMNDVIRQTTDEDPDVENKDADDMSNPYRESWQYEFNTVSTWSKMSTQVRHMLYHCPSGSSKLTALGCKRYVPVHQVLVTLLQGRGYMDIDNTNIGLQGMTSSEDMSLILKSMTEDFPWVSYIIEQIESDPQLKTLLFRNMRRTSMSYGILQRSNKNGKVSDIDILDNNFMIINGTNSFNSIYTSLLNNLKASTALCKLSIFEDGDIKSNNIPKVRKLVEDIIDGGFNDMLPSEAKAAAKENNGEVINNLTTALNAIGFAIDKSGVETVIGEDPQKFAKMNKQKNNLLFLARWTKKILDYIEDNEIETTDKFLDIEHDNFNTKDLMSFYRDISRALVLFDSSVVEPSFREDGKTMYSFVLPSSTDDFITGMQGKMFDGVTDRGVRSNKSTAKYISETFGNDPRLYSASENKYRNLVLQIALEMGNEKMDYVTMVDTDTNHGEKQPYEKLNAVDRVKIIWNMMLNNNREGAYANTRGDWFPIPTPSDSGRMAFIKIKRPTDSQIREAYKERIIKELERITECHDVVNGELVYNGAYDHLPEIYRKNKDKFCTFPALNNAKNDNGDPLFDKKKLLVDFIDCINSGSMGLVDDRIDTLVNYIIDANRIKFKEENVQFCAEILSDKNNTEEILNYFIDAQSAMQFSFNELLNGEDAYYTGYNQGSDNQQKRAKQIIVPVERIDYLNQDFLRNYALTHKGKNIYNADGSVNAKAVTERVVYIEDPKVRAAAYDEIVQVYDEALRNGVIDKQMYNSFLEEMESIKHTDGQALRSFSSMQQLMYALGEMKEGDELDEALKRIASGKQLPSDAYIVRTAEKPFASGFVELNESDGSVRRMPFQHKLSEQILAAALQQAATTMLGENSALKAITRFMDQHGIDVAIFNSAVKVGNNGYIKTTDKDGNYIIDFESSDENTIYTALERSLQDKTFYPIHEIPYSLYGIVSQVPNDGPDTTIDIGSQIQKLISQDLPDFVIEGHNDEGEPIYNYKPYHVAGIDKDFSASELRTFYNALMTERIKRAYHEVTGLFADTEKLSRELMYACKNSSRNSSYLEHAFSLDENGNFIIPLCDMSTMNLSSEFLNSIIRKAVTKISVPGKQLVSMSPFGLHNKLKLEFNYETEIDDEGNETRRAVSLKSIPCLLPAWSKHLIEKCLDEKGFINMNKLKDVDERMFEMIGLRIPTQSRNFMLPLKCVGFLPSILGDTIITASDVVVFQDADFDVDKIPTYFPSFKASYYVDKWKDKAREDYKKYEMKLIDKDKLQQYYNEFLEKKKADGDTELYSPYDALEDIKANGNVADYLKDKDTELMPYDEWLKLHKEDYLRPGGPKIEYISYDAEKDMGSWTEEEINNAIIQVMRSMLTSKAVATQSISAGSMGKINAAVKEINEILGPKRFPDSAGDISSKIQQEVRNNDGKNMIAVFAVAIAMHAIAQRTRLSLNDKVHGFKLFGKSLSSLHDVTREGTEILEYLSSGIGAGLGAAADNSKFPKLNVLNVNDNTASVASLLLRLGYTEREMALFLNIPAIRLYTSTGSTGAFEISDNYSAITELPSLKDSKGYYEDMISVIKAGYGDNLSDDYVAFNNAALNMFMKLKDIGDRLHTLDMLSRGDSGSGAPHGAIENNVARMIQYELFEELEEYESEDEEKNNPLHMFNNWKHLFKVSYDMDESGFDDKVYSVKDEDNNGSRISQAYITYGTLGAYKELAKIYPGLDNKYFREKIKETIRKRYDGIASATNVKNVLFELYSYLMTKHDFAIEGDKSIQSARDYYINDFPLDAENLFIQFPFLQNTTLFKHLSLYNTSENSDPFIKLEYNGVMTPEIRDRFTSDWQSLFYYKDKTGETEDERKENTRIIRKFAADLFMYCFFRNGFRFSDGSFAHLAPIEARLNNNKYITMLREMADKIDSKVLENFDVQYLRNHLHEWKVCPFMKKKPQRFKSLNGVPQTITMPVFESYVEAEERSFDREDKKYYDTDGKPREAFLIRTKINGKYEYLYYIRTSMDENNATYLRVDPLGWGLKAQEYDASADGYAMKSVYDQDEVRNDLNPKKKRKSKKNKSQTKQKSSSSESRSEETSNSSEEPSESGFDWSWLSGLSKTKEEKKSGLTLTSSKARSSKTEDDEDEKKTKKSKGKKKEEKKTETKKKESKQKTNVSTIDGGIMDTEIACVDKANSTIAIFENTGSNFQNAIKKHAEKNNKRIVVSNASSIGQSVIDRMVNQIAYAAKRSFGNKARINITGSRAGEFKSMDFGSAVELIKNILSEVKKGRKIIKDGKVVGREHINIDKIITSGQPGIAQAAVIAAESLGLNVEIISTDSYAFQNEKGVIVEDKDRFMANFGNKHKSEAIKNEEKIYDSSKGSFIEANRDWDRETVAGDKKTLYIFTDNTDRTSGDNKIPEDSPYYKKYGTRGKLYYPGKKTSAVIRGLNNAFPISTMRLYSPGGEKEYIKGRWNDEDINEFIRTIDNEIKDIIEAFDKGPYKRVVFPNGGFFDRAISAINEEERGDIYDALKRRIKKLEKRINEIAENKPKTYTKNTDDDSPFDLKQDDVLTVDMIDLYEKNGKSVDKVINSNISKIYIADAIEDAGVRFVLDNGTRLNEGTLFLVGEKGKPIEKSKNIRVYDGKTGKLIQNDITVKGDGVEIPLLDRKQSGHFRISEISTYIIDNLHIQKGTNLNRIGFQYMNENNPLC